MTATIDYARKLRRLQEEFDDIEFVDNISGGFLGYNDGDGRVRVLKPERLEGVEGVKDGFAAARYIALHELGHNYVSDRDPTEHARMDADAINSLIGMGDYDAATEAYNMHRVRARNANGRDAEFSRRALAYLSDGTPVMGWDGGDELTAFKQRYGGGLPDGEEEGIITGMFKRMKDNLTASIHDEYGLVHDLKKNAKGYVKNGLVYVALNGVSTLIPNPGFLKTWVEGTRDNYKKNAISHMKDLSPLVRTMTVGFGPGKTDIERMWVYIKGAKQYPIFFSTYKKPNAPLPANLDEGIKHVDNEGESPFNHMTNSVSEGLLNKDFVGYNANGYTGGFYNGLFKQEPERLNRLFVKEETKGSHLWLPDPVSEAALPAAYVGKVKVFKKNVSKSGIAYDLGRVLYGDDRPKGLATSNVINDLCMDASIFGFGGIVVDHLAEKMKIGEQLRREFAKGYINQGSNFAESFGLNRWVDYE